MKLRKFVLAVLPLAILIAACSDPTSPRPPEETGNENPPTTAFQTPGSLISGAQGLRLA